MSRPTLRFLGGARTVTGSKFLLETPKARVLVDCGLFQGVKELRQLNWAPLGVDAAGIDAVVLTHAHLDHSGYLPLLVRQGFRGPVFGTAPTGSLLALLLLDAGRIQEEDAALARRGGYSKHNPPLPLFTRQEAEAAAARFKAVPQGRWLPLAEGIRFRLTGSGHILGSSLVEIRLPGTRLVFSGDLGRKKPLLLDPPAPLPRTDYLILESTYGDRRHPKEPPHRALARVITETLSGGGDVLIPAFAVGRTQDLLYLLHRLRKQNRIPDVPIYLDSPMAIEATEMFYRFPDWHRLGTAAIHALGRTAIPVPGWKESQGVLGSRKRKIVIAGSGMATGGRVLSHLEKMLPDPRHTVLLVGYQAAGTRGALLRCGASELKMRGAFVPVRARVEEVPGLSAHADQGEILEWLRRGNRRPRSVFLVHGEPQAADALRVRIEHSLRWTCDIPAPGSEKVLSAFPE